MAESPEEAEKMMELAYTNRPLARGIAQAAYRQVEEYYSFPGAREPWKNALMDITAPQKESANVLS